MQTNTQIKLQDIAIGETYLFVLVDHFALAHKAGVVKSIQTLDSDGRYVHITLDCGAVFVNPYVYPADEQGEMWQTLQDPAALIYTKAN